MSLADYDFELPEELIAQVPLPVRGGARLMVVDRSSGRFEIGQFVDLNRHLRPGDLLVLNDTRVIPARVYGQKATGGRVELLLVRRLSPDGLQWETLIRASRPPRPGTRIVFPGGGSAVVQRRCEEDLWEVSLILPSPFDVWLGSVGEIPLPPYIRRKPDSTDAERYQTVFAQIPGAVAAPTAGLHFSREHLEELEAMGIGSCSVTLHVGPGTFQPLRSERIDDHRMHAEEYAVPRETAERIRDCRSRGGRVVAVGTTVVRTLESAVDSRGILREGEGSTRLFIRPGFRFRIVDMLLTNFHLPKSTLLILVSAFAGRERILSAYRAAVAHRFRFFSYGDAMLIR